MKIQGVIIKDSEKGNYFSFIQEFPGVCAQGATIEEAKSKMNTYFQAYLHKVSQMGIEVSGDPVELM